MTMLPMNTVTLVFVFTAEVQRLHEVIFIILSVEVNYARGMWACCFWQVLEQCAVENATLC